MAIIEYKSENHEAWLALRRNYIGGSDAAAVVGMNPFSSAYSLWAEKTGRVPGFDGNLTTEVGTYLEEFVAKKFTEETGKKVRRNNRSMVNTEYHFAIADIDREIVGEDAGLEIKTTSEMNTRRFKNGEYPANYYVQCVHYMAVTGRKKWYLAVLIGNREFKIFEIERDEEEIAALMSAEKDFWELVKNNTPPAPDGSKASDDTLNAVYPESDGSTVDLSGFDADLAQYIALDKQIKELVGLQNELANRVKLFMGDASGGSSNGHKVSFPSSVRSTFDTKAFSEANQGIDLAPYYKKTSYRVFKVTVRK